MKKSISILLTAAMAASLLTACGSSTASTTAAPAETTAAASTAAPESSETTTPAETQSSQTAEASYTIGIGQFAEHGSLDNCREGFLAGLAEEGIEEGVNLTVLYENSQTDGGTASQIATNFAGKNVDLMCGIATPMAQSLYSVAMKSDIPVIFTAVTDPVAAELANADGTPVGEITGTSDKLPVEAQLKMIREILPDAKTIGIMYTTSEVNSESAIAEYKELAPNYGFEIVESGISSSADIPLAADTLIGKVDCITNLTDNTVVASLPVILSKAAVLCKVACAQRPRRSNGGGTCGYLPVSYTHLDVYKRQGLHGCPHPERAIRRGPDGSRHIRQIHPFACLHPEHVRR